MVMLNLRAHSSTVEQQPFKLGTKVRFLLGPPKIGIRLLADGGF